VGYFFKQFLHSTIYFLLQSFKKLFSKNLSLFSHCFCLINI
jgi:hypothetical protein